MPITLVEASKLSSNALQRGVIETVVEDSSLLQRLPFIEVQGNAYSYVRSNALPDASFRDINEGYTESTGTFESKVASLAILGGDADVDRFLVQTQGGQVADLRAAVTAQKAMAVRRRFQEAFIHGDSAADPKEFDGLDKMLSGTAQELEAGANGLPIIGADDDDRHAFLDALELGLAAVNGTPDVILVNRPVLAAFRSSARRLTTFDQTIDAFGKPVMSYAGIPVMDIGNDEDGNPIIPQTETQGSSSVASSIYIVRFGQDGGVVGLTNGGVQAYDVGELDDKPAYRTRIEFYCAIAPLSLKSAAVIRGVLAS